MRHLVFFTDEMELRLARGAHPEEEAEVSLMGTEHRTRSVRILGSADLFGHRENGGPPTGPPLNLHSMLRSGMSSLGRMGQYNQ